MPAAGKRLSNESLICNTWAPGCLVIFLSNYPAILLFRYSIDRHTDLDRFFNIQEDGYIKTTKALDREEKDWHNISVIASEACKYSPDGANSLWKSRFREQWRENSCSGQHFLPALAWDGTPRQRWLNWLASIDLLKSSTSLDNAGKCVFFIDMSWSLYKFCLYLKLKKNSNQL